MCGSVPADTNREYLLNVPCDLSTNASLPSSPGWKLSLTPLATSLSPLSPSLSILFSSSPSSLLFLTPSLSHPPSFSLSLSRSVFLYPFLYPSLPLSAVPDLTRIVVASSVTTCVFSDDTNAALCQRGWARRAEQGGGQGGVFIRPRS